MTASRNPARTNPPTPAEPVDDPISPLWDPDEPPATFSWTSPRTGATLQLIAAEDMPFGVFEDAMESGAAGVAMLVRQACVRRSDHEAMRALRMGEVNRLFDAWNGGASVGESSSSST